ncbi:MAG: hypothetical protein QW727_03420 [Candidatus Pacearchaeota archaeon]
MIDRDNLNEKSEKKIISIWVAFFIIAGSLAFFIFLSTHLTGKMVLNIITEYHPNETLQGKISLSLKSGELIPADSLLKISLGGSNYEYKLSEVVDDKKVSGDFYVEGVSISGSGEGYGVKGVKDSSEGISFIMRITSTSNSGGIIEDNSEITGNVSEITGNVSEITGNVSEITGNVSEITGNVSEITGNVSEITGSVIAEISREISGVVSKDKPFVYELEDGETAEIISSEQDVTLSISGNTATITTEYSSGQTGFGNEFLGNDFIKILEVNLSSLEIKPADGKISVEILYDGILIASVSSILDVNSPEQEIYNESFQIISENIEDYALTDEELFALKSKTGVDAVEITKSYKINDRIVIRFEAGRYWLENSYDSYSNDNLDFQIELDRAKFSKRLAKSLLESKQSPEKLEGYIGIKNLLEKKIPLESQEISENRENSVKSEENHEEITNTNETQ